MYFTDTFRVMMRYTAHVSSESTASPMPNRSFIPEPPCQPTITMSSAPTTPIATPKAPRRLRRSPMSKAAHTMVATGVSVAMMLKYTGVVKCKAHAVSVCETTKPNKPPPMMTRRSRRSTRSRGMKSEMSQNMAAAPMQRVAI